jgi:phosphoglycerate dehydrogenase-like enzyme
MPRPFMVVSAPEALFQSFFSPAHLRRLSRTFHWKRNSSSTMSPQLRRQLADAKALITTWDSPLFGNDLLELAPELRVIGHCGGEVKSRFGHGVFERVTVTTVPEPMGRATAELGAALVLYCARNVDYYRCEVNKPTDRIFEEVHLHGTPESVVGREIGMIGLGRIGRTLVDFLRPFEVGWQVYDPYASRSLSKQYPVEFASLSAMLKRSTLLVLTAALTKETRHILDRHSLARLPDGATIINIARGGLIDLDALTREVRKKRLRCAIDVTDPVEPLPRRHPLRSLPGAILTPHIGGGTSKARQEMADALIDDLERFFRGDSVKNRVTNAMLARMT